MTELADWDSFYLIVGSVAGALIGLQFVAISLIARSSGEMKEEAGAAFATPTIIHFCVAFLLAAFVRVPWKSPTGLAASLGAIGVSGVVYSIIVTVRMRRQDFYTPVFEDWLFHSILPSSAYVLLAVAGVTLANHLGTSMFAVGGAELLLIFIGIHNAWDAVTYNLFNKKGEDEDTDESEEPAS